MRNDGYIWPRVRIDLLPLLAIETTVLTTTSDSKAANSESAHGQLKTTCRALAEELDRRRSQANAENFKCSSAVGRLGSAQG